MQMRGTSSIVVAVAVIAAVVTLPGCGCSEKDLHGDADTDTDAPDGLGDADGDGDDGADVSCPTCDDGDPCTVDTCDTGTSTCTNVPYDGDEDGYPGTLAPDGTTVCPGTDCDDNDPLTHPGAEEICMDGIDEDCDTIVDGPRAMLSTVHLKTLAEGGLNPDLAWTGSEFVAVWDEDWSRKINMARVGLDGELVGDIINLVDVADTGAGQAGRPRLAWTGSEIGVSYETGDIFMTGSPALLDVMFMRLGPAGDVVEASPPLNDVDTLAWASSFAWTGSEYGIAWSDGRDDACAAFDTCLTEIYFTRLDGGGVEIGSEARITDVVGSTFVGPARPMWTGSEFVLFWGGEEGAGEWTPFITRLDPDGVRIGGDVTMAHSGSVAWTGSEFAMTWYEDVSGNAEVFLARMDPTGVEIGSPVQVTDAPHFSGNADIVWTGSELGEVWLDGRDTGCDGPPTVPGDCDRDLFFTLLDAGGTKIWDDVKITVRDTWVVMPELAWTGSEFGLSWFEYSDESGEMELAVSFDVVSFCE